MDNDDKVLIKVADVIASADLRDLFEAIISRDMNFYVISIPFIKPYLYAVSATEAQKEAVQQFINAFFKDKYEVIM